MYHARTAELIRGMKPITILMAIALATALLVATALPAANASTQHSAPISRAAIRLPLPRFPPINRVRVHARSQGVSDYATRQKLRVMRELDQARRLYGYYKWADRACKTFRYLYGDRPQRGYLYYSAELNFYRFCELLYG